jgi:hypothetical protein
VASGCSGDGEEDGSNFFHGFRGRFVDDGSNLIAILSYGKKIYHMTKIGRGDDPFHSLFTLPDRTEWRSPERHTLLFPKCSGVLENATPILW